MSEIKLFPTLEEAAALMPQGRAPYSLARSVFGAENLMQQRILTLAALSEIAKSSAEETLEPPLPPDLRAAVEVVDQHIQKEGDSGRLIVKEEFDYLASKFILAAVIEHGYRSDL